VVAFGNPVGSVTPPLGSDTMLCRFEQKIPWNLLCLAVVVMGSTVLAAVVVLQSVVLEFLLLDKVRRALLIIENANTAFFGITKCGAFLLFLLLLWLLLLFVVLGSLLPTA
jgi:hypothetical protein